MKRIILTLVAALALGGGVLANQASAHDNWHRPGVSVGFGNYGGYGNYGYNYSYRPQLTLPYQQQYYGSLFGNQPGCQHHQQFRYYGGFQPQPQFQYYNNPSVYRRGGVTLQFGF